MKMAVNDQHRASGAKKGRWAQTSGRLLVSVAAAIRTCVASSTTIRGGATSASVGMRRDLILADSGASRSGAGALNCDRCMQPDGTIHLTT